MLQDQGIVVSNGNETVVVPDELKKDFLQGPSAQLTRKIDELLIAARVARSSAADLNLLQDLKDLSVGHASAQEAGGYVDWRLAHRDWFMKPEVLPSWERPKVDTNAVGVLDQKIADSSEALRPHWIYLKGAYYYNKGNDTESQQCFDRILKDYPSDPRAETTFFMKGRCLLSQSVGNKETPDAAMLDEAKAQFEHYLQRYPKGRYLNDVLGWLGGAAYRSGRYADAIGYYIQQAENKDHPEDQQAAVAMIEKCFYHACDQDDEELDHLARHPAVAMALAYYAIHKIPDGNHWYRAQEEVDKSNENSSTWRSKVLSKLAQAVLKEKACYQSALNVNRFVAILAHAASDQGNQAEATQLLKFGKAKSENDDYAYVKGLVLQRSGRLPECVSAYRQFLQKYPDSPLASGVRYRLGLALHDLHQDGAAVSEIAAIRGHHLSPPQEDKRPSSSFIGEDYSGASPQLVSQTLDTLVNFAPLNSLQSILAQGGSSKEQDLRTEVADVIAERTLADEDFSALRQIQQYQRIPLSGASELLKAIPVQTNSSPLTASNAFTIAGLWATNLPLKYALVEPLDRGNVGSQRFDRLTNASVLGFTNAIEEFDKRNPWTHAIAWWSKAIAADPTNATSAQSLWNIIMARRKTVQMSPYEQAHAADTDLQSVSRKEYELLMSNYPSSEVARQRAAYWTFPTREELNKANEDYYSYPQMVWVSPYSEDAWYDAFGCQRDERNGDSDWEDVCHALGELPDRVKKLDAKGFSKAVSELNAKATPGAFCMERMPVMNCLSDLKQLTQAEGFESLDPEIRDRYVRLRMGILCNTVLADIYGFPHDSYEASDEELQQKIRELASDPKSASIHDFVDFLELALISNHLEQFDHYNDRDYPLLAAKSELFLKNHPKSLKREAAVSLKLRGIDYASRYHCDRGEHSWPRADRWGGEELRHYERRVPFDREAFDHTLAQYQREFPTGDNRNAVLSYRVDAAYQNQDWAYFLDLALQLDKTGAREFREQLANQLADCFVHLDDDAQRSSLLPLILSRPTATAYLTAFIEKARGIPYLKDYLLEQIKNPRKTAYKT